MEEEKVLTENKENESKKTKKGSVVKYIINIVLVLVVTAIAIIMTLWGKFDAVMNELAQTDWVWILVIVAILLVVILIRSFVYYLFARLFTRDFKFHQAIAVDQVGQFYNAVTPGASGGQVMQAYTYKKQGLNISSAVSILAMYSIIYQAVLIIYGIISFIAKYNDITAIGGVVIGFDEFSFTVPIWLLTILGFIVNFSIIFLIFVMANSRKFHNFIMGPVISLLAKIKILKNPEKNREALRISVENFKIEFKRLSTNIPFTILISILFFIYLTLKFSIPYFVGLSLGNTNPDATFFDAIFLSNYHQMVSGLIPVPGGAGTSEFFFNKLFWNFFDVEGKDPTYLCSTALMIWRSLTFTIPIIIAAFVSAFYHPKGDKRRGEFPEAPKETMFELSKQTIAIRLKEIEDAENAFFVSEDKDENEKELK